jgi:PAP2 superfamily
MAKMLVAITILCAVLSAPAGRAYAAPTADELSSETSTQSVNQVLQWNRTLLAIVRTKGAQPATIHPTRSFAMMHAAIYDAVNAIDGTHKPYLVQITTASPTASQDAAAAQSAHDVLVSLYPRSRNALDSQLKQALAQIPDGTDKDDGVTIGKHAAAGILGARTDDGSSAKPPKFVFTNPPVPGDYQSTPPNFPAQPQFTHWSKVTPFALSSAHQFRPGPPPALTSDIYSDDFNETKSLGIANSVAATPDQALTGKFWNGAIQNYWNEIAQTAAVDRNLTTAQNARLFALLNFAFADSVIAFYDAKYTYKFWRPVTAIRAADSDNNPDTHADPKWLPEVTNTTPDPSYPGAHAVISEAGASVLNSFFNNEQLDFQVTSEVMPGTVRSFTNFSAAAQEATLSRIFAGVHFRSDLASGGRLGSEVANFVVANSLTPVHGKRR